MGQSRTEADATDGRDAPRVAALCAIGLHVIVEDLVGACPITAATVGRPSTRIVEDVACIPHAYACATDAFIAMNEILSKGHVDGRAGLRVIGPNGDETPAAPSFLEHAPAAARA